MCCFPYIGKKKTHVKVSKYSFLLPNDISIKSGMNAHCLGIFCLNKAANLLYFSIVEDVSTFLRSVFLELVNRKNSFIKCEMLSTFPSHVKITNFLKSIIAITGPDSSAIHTKILTAE